MTDESRGEILLYEAEDGNARLEVRLEAETVWLSLDQIAALFNRDKSVISRHLSNIFSSGELGRNSVVAKNATVQIFLHANGILYRQDDGKRIADNALVALTLMIAESRPDPKGVMIRVIANLIN